MNTATLLTIAQIIVSLLLITLVLLQQRSAGTSIVPRQASPAR